MKKNRESGGNLMTTILSGVALATAAAFLIWAFLQPGMLGLYHWVYKPFIIGFSVFAALPALLLGASALSKGAVGRVLSGAATGLSALVMLVTLGAGLYLLSNAYGSGLPAARPALLDPAEGLPLRAGADGSPTFRVFLSSDPHWARAASNAAARSAILRRAEAEHDAGRLDAFICLGDTVEMGMFAADWREAMDGMLADAPRLPYLALMGNHDALIGGARRWRAALAGGSGPGGVPEGGLSASSWRLDAGPVHFIALDLLWGPEGFGKKERAWLAAQLDSIPATDYIVVLSHSFFYSSGYIDEGTGMPWYDHADMLREVAPLIAGKADLVVSGHNHYMEWLEADGTAWAVVGAMGGKPDPVPTYVSPASVWIEQGSFGYLALELTKEGLSCSFEDQNGNQLFQRTITK